VRCIKAAVSYLAPGRLRGLLWGVFLLFLFVIIQVLVSIDIIDVPELPAPAASLCIASDVP